MTLTVNAWFAWAVAALALVGACTILYLVSGVLERLGDWWRDRREPLIDEDIAECCDDCGANLVRGEEHSSACVYLEDLPGPIPLAPERSAVELGFTGPQPGLIVDGSPFWPARERRAPWWEVQQRAAYESLGLEYPSGMLEAVRYHPAGP